MSRFIMPTILAAIAIAIFFVFTQPFYAEVGTLRAEQASYTQALDNSKVLTSERDKLTQKFNTIGAENMDKLKKFLPENVDNIRLILEIEKIAMPYGMTLKDVKYSTPEQIDPNANPNTQIQGGYVNTAPKEYGVWDLEFSTTGSYNNFLNFLSDMEHNLRIVDVSSVEFSSEAGGGIKDSPAMPYQYTFKIKTYWLKN